MIGNFRALPDLELQALFANPSRVEQLLYESLLGGASNGNELEVDKAWHGLHFLLTAAPGKEASRSTSSSPAERRSATTSATAPLEA
jgi:Domain of unknown function (DUF1877)